MSDYPIFLLGHHGNSPRPVRLPGHTPPALYEPWPKATEEETVARLLGGFYGRQAAARALTRPGRWTRLANRIPEDPR